MCIIFYSTMWYYSLIIMCGMFISYNWIIASVTTLVGIFTYLIIDFMINSFDYSNIIISFLIIN